jgi:hypothetical protein
MDTLSKVDAEGVETFFSRNEKVRSMLQGMRESSKSVLSCYQQEFYVTAIERHGRCEKDQLNMEMLEIELP